MDLIEALINTKIKYPGLKTVRDFQSILNNTPTSGVSIFKEAIDTVKAYIYIKNEDDSFDEFIKWVDSRVETRPDEYKKHGGHTGIMKSYSERYVEKHNKVIYPDKCLICGNQLPKNFVTNCSKCGGLTRS